MVASLGVGARAERVASRRR